MVTCLNNAIHNDLLRRRRNAESFNRKTVKMEKLVRLYQYEIHQTNLRKMDIEMSYEVRGMNRIISNDNIISNIIENISKNIDN